MFTRGSNLKVQDVDALYAQSDFSKKFQALGFKHELLTGIDFAQEKKRVYAARTATQGGVDLTKPTTTAGTPDNGNWINEDARVFRDGNEFTAKNFGIYAQDLVQIAPMWKLLGGLRVLRGGSWYVNDTYTRAAFRIRGGTPDRRSDINGFRLARNAP